MVPQIDDRVLRSVNSRLKNTSIKQLPKILPQIARQLVAAKCDVGNHAEATWLKARITSLLQDRTSEGRWSAIVLVKTILEAGGSKVMFEDKDRVGGWIRGMIDILKKPGPVALKKCTVLAITRAFMLTWEHPTLVRELTTPNLPTYITTCLQHFSTSPLFVTSTQSELVHYVLESFAGLLSRHHTIFRSFQAQIRTVAIATLCNSPYNSSFEHMLSVEDKDAASKVLVLLHQCAQKGGGAAEWERAIHDLLVSIHATADQVYRAVVEDWQPMSGGRSAVDSREDLSDEPEMVSSTDGYPSWIGVRSGAERLKALLELLQAYITTPSTAAMKVPLGRILEILTRLMSVQVPQVRQQVGLRVNPQVSRAEREDLWSTLPNIHISTMEVIFALIERLGKATLPICSQFMELIVWLFEAEKSDANIRTAMYCCLAEILTINGPSLSKSTVESLDKIIKSCCSDLLPSKSMSTNTASLDTSLTDSMTSSKGSNGVSSGLPSSTTHMAFEDRTGLQQAASNLLPILLTKLPAHLVSKASRTSMDRTAILTRNTTALAASVLNPAPQKPSLLPLMSAIAPESAFTEAILRPRMPVILGGKAEAAELDVEEIAGDDDAEGEVEEHRENENKEFPLTERGDVTLISWAMKLGQDPAPEPMTTADQFRSTQAFANTTGPVLPSKRQSRDDTDVDSSTKKPRIMELQHTITEERKGTEAETYHVIAEESTIVQVVPERLQPAEEGDEDEDGSDFEIPQLVMGDPSDDEDVSDEGDQE